MPIKSLQKTWIDIKLNFNNQFYNEHFTEYDTKVLSLEGNIKSLFFKRYFFAVGYFYALADNISYNDGSDLFKSTRINRSYIKEGLKINVKKTFKQSLISSLASHLYLLSC